METLPLADAKSQLSAVVERAVATHERTLITKNGRPAAVLLSIEDWESFQETFDVLSDPEAMAAIHEAETADASEFASQEDIDAIVAERKARKRA